MQIQLHNWNWEWLKKYGFHFELIEPQWKPTKRKHTRTLYAEQCVEADERTPKLIGQKLYTAA